MFPEIFVHKTKTHNFIQKLFFEIPAVYEIMNRNMVQQTGGSRKYKRTQKDAKSMLDN